MIETAVEAEIDQSAMTKAAQRWLQAFESAVNTGDRPVSSLFSSDGWWRDVLAFTWTIVTFTGTERIDAGSRDALTRPRILQRLCISDGLSNRTAIFLPVQLSLEPGNLRAGLLLYRVNLREGGAWRPHLNNRACALALFPVISRIGRARWLPFLEAGRA